MTNDPPRSVAGQWTLFRRTVLHHYADDDPRMEQAKAIFMAGAYGCFKALCAVLAETEGDADGEVEVERFGAELEHWANVTTGEIKVQ